jgi:hypothetical protein
MGLDMYLYARRHLWSFPEDGPDTQIAKEVASLVKTDLEVSEVKVKAGCWRKANQVHRWFVQNVQEGTDDCGNYYVSRQNLIDLREICQRVMADKSLAPVEFPTTSGFFFGSTEYDDWYYNDLQETIDIVDKALTLDNNWDFEYHSSW